ncbi:hypothetical protein VPHK567_0044 [Vibrio phage K567]
MVEIIGSKYCLACVKICERLDKRGVEYTFLDAFKPTERYRVLQKIGEDDGYIHHPIGFINGECIGSGMSILNHIDKFLEEE